MSTPVASGSRVPPWPILTSKRWSRRRLRWNPFSRLRRARSSSNHGLNVFEGLKCRWRWRITSAEETPWGLWTAANVRLRFAFNGYKTYQGRLRESSRQSWSCAKVGSLWGMAFREGESSLEKNIFWLRCFRLGRRYNTLYAKSLFCIHSCIHRYIWLQIFTRGMIVFIYIFKSFSEGISTILNRPWETQANR